MLARKHLTVADGLSKLKLKTYPSQQRECCSCSLRAGLVLHTGRRLHAPCAELKRLELAAARTDHGTAEGCQDPLVYLLDTPSTSTLERLSKIYLTDGLCLQRRNLYTEPNEPQSTKDAKRASPSSPALKASRRKATTTAFKLKTRQHALLTDVKSRLKPNL